MTHAPTEPPKYGEPTRAKCSAPGRYLTDHLVLCVSAQCNDLFIDEWDPDGKPFETWMVVPSDDAIRGAMAALQHRAKRSV